MSNEYQEKFARLLQLSINVRTSQNKFFAARKQGFSGKAELQESKTAEHNLDAFIKAEKVNMKNSNQGKLF
ncbi:hypothetical protein [Rhizosphaericola mali]|uniref:Uncharacterized protein n=1 Tax=Rhizosphaericola mali TaxID=2545455 RepID=A0A5P2FZ58_9BACT|nr:hypothetical protein [Rhizosphaericola mali]QES88834.1 hypothetical protein E0W69_009270 [Rhizosphaericola mali]